MKYYKIIILIFALNAYGASPISMDSRIKEYIYNENEVFLITMYNGYQSMIELGKGEEVRNLFVGDVFAWKIKPIGQRILIKPLETNVHTNMTIITNRRTYYFDIIAKSADEEVDKNLVYAIRFFYPDEKNQSVPR